MRLTCGTFAASNGELFPDIVSSAVLAEDGNSLALFCVNRNFDQAIDVGINLRGLEFSDLLESRVMKSDDLNATNTADHPERVRAEDGPAATVREGVWCLTVPPASWSVFRFGCSPTGNIPLPRSAVVRHPG
jgi:alpha-N-arabinofuranosidase